MNARDLNYLQDTVDNEGFHYAFCHYSHFHEIDDGEFHRLRANYEDAAQELADYLNVSI